MIKKTYKLTQIEKVAQQIVGQATSKTLCFYASMGAGKTTLIKAILQELGATDTGHSPTFGIVNEYHDQNGELLAYHFDFYRLEDEMEALDMGLDDYLNKDVWIFIEWPEKISSFLPDDATEIRIEIIGQETRHLDIGR
ncbi:tRNA (adenosine(37)-N6)-threonylcarbamoyltransferase complex ATPase subunit type 1 TsaE [Pricia sp. S334]|uniref:tRNA threonylcarbamoyladenosine biosynthesis protein TsaE n=1 Tax=Pricia mediterranea TaxID=3076079 RepID=A0ABU3LA58_9FLAO|nr:tRNA (adenosine(37)-N6)-threonylcarbamoyltransferase complex ATPase subunit type 1 TsaE [Pricia sp. S334]MDT7830624.1 tRNA (adenosine(37)-N6)-threonylcarbamoyltransferase complex ATPase subunit type 1 TsaE [Pricia sp. S334]